MAFETRETTGPVKACVDSGCTSTAVPEQLGWLLDEVADPAPVNKLKIADYKALDILKIGKSSKLKVKGWRPENRGEADRGHDPVLADAGGAGDAQGPNPAEDPRDDQGRRLRRCACEARRRRA